MDSDRIHDFGTHPEWNESFYFNLYDREKDICGYMRIGLRPNRREKSMFCFFMMPDGSLVGMKDALPYDNAQLAAKGLRFDLLKQEERWRLTFDGTMPKLGGRIEKQTHVEFSLDFEAINDIFDYRSCLSSEAQRMSQDVASEHFEQFGRVKGKLMMGLDEWQISALGGRDHSWGVRDWTAPKMWTWLTCQFSEESAFNITRLVMPSGVVEGGFLYEDGGNTPINRTDLKADFMADGSPRSFELKLTGKKGEATRVTAIVMKKAQMPFQGQDGKTSTLHETLARYTMEGQTGYGIAEFLVRRG